MKHRFVGGLAAVLVVLAACGEDATPPAAPETPSAEAPAFPMTITDDDGVEVTIPVEPERIVTFAPSMTEIVYALGLGDRLVGVSGPFDDFPAEAADVEEVGGAGDFGVDPNIEKVVSLEPDVFLTISGGDQWKERLREVGVPVVTLNAEDFPDLLDDIRAVGSVTGASEEAESLAADMEAQAEGIEGSATAATCFFEVFYPPLTTVGPNTFVFDMLERAGCEPVTGDATSDYPEWSVDDLVADRPEVYFFTPESSTTVKAIGKRPGFAAIPAVEDGRVVLVGDVVTRPGPRVVDGLQQLAEALSAA